MEQNKTDYRKGMIADMKEPKLRFKASNGREFPEWEEKKIGSLLKVTSVKRVHASDWTNEGVPFYRAREIISLYAGQSISPLYISEVCYAKFSAISGTIHTDDLLVTGVGTIGVPYLVKNGDRFYFKDGNIIWIQNRGSVVGLYLYYCFDTDFVKQQIKNMAGIGTVGTYTIDSAKSTVIPFPSLLEQRKIADFLSTIDEIITTTKAELKAWQERKKGVMQKLFSQEVRFRADDGSEFSEWEETEIGKIGSFTKGALLSKADISDVGTPLVLYGELYTTYSEVAYEIERKTEAIVDKKYYSKIGDVVIPTSGESPEEISTATCIMVPNVILAGDLDIFRSTVLDGRIMSYILNHQVKNKIATIAQGKSIVHIHAKELSKIIIKFPVDIEEQQKIADCLSSLDEVINQIKAELQAWKEFKKGLLQQMFV